MRALLLSLLLVTPAAAQDRAATEAQFRDWLETTIWPEAQEDGVSRATFDTALKNITLDWDLNGLIPPGTTPPARRAQTQAEFRSPGAYFRQDSLAATARLGRDMAVTHAQALAETEEITGVPGRIILAIWGRETAFGRVAIPHNAFRVLATRGFMGSRKPYYTEELIAALSIVEAGHIAPQDMRSSWAGAMGQPQFVPRSFLAYATDGDGDGRADIWTSEADVIRSIGNFLGTNGWEPGRDWGYEVTLPEGLSCALEGPTYARTISEWLDLGITRVSGRPFPDHELAGEASLLLPEGTNGPAFLVTPNFYMIKTYNNSDLYALYIGNMADRIAYGAGDFTAPWGPVDPMLRSDVAALQEGLIAAGFDTGGADGLAGFRTRSAIGLWQQEQGLTPTCWPSRSLVEALAP